MLLLHYQRKGRLGLWAACVLSASLFAFTTFGQGKPLVAGDERLLAEVRLVERSTLPLVLAKCFGGDRTLCLDTGSALTVFNASLRAKLDAPIGSITVRAVSGRSKAEVFEFPDLSIGTLRLDGKNALCMDLRHVSNVADQQFDGILGLDAFEDCILQLDLASGKLRFYEMVPEKIRKESSRFGIARAQQGWVVTVSLANSVDEDALLDSGNQSSLVLSSDVFDRLRREKAIRDCHETVMVDALRESSIVFGTLSEVSLGKFKHKGLRVMRGGAHSMIGVGYLKRYLVTIDFTKGDLYLQPSETYDAPEVPTDKSGLILAHSQGGIVVHQLQKDSPAIDAGIREGDRLVSVNNRSVDQLYLFEIRNLLRRDGEKAEVSVLRDGKVLSRVIQLHEFRGPHRPDASDEE